jgi:N-acetylneuraminic acid mutarotase
MPLRGIIILVFIMMPVSLAYAQENVELSPRVGAKMVYDLEYDRVVLFGGYTLDETRDFYNDTWVLSPVDATWTKLLIDGPCNRGSHSMAYNPDLSNILLFGGQTNTKRLSDTWVFDCNTETWTEIETETTPEGRSDFDMVYDPNNQVFIIYGGWGDRTGLQHDTWTFDLETSTWNEIETENTPGRIYGQSLEYDHLRERVILYGGHLRSPISHEYVDEVWYFHLENSSWRQSSSIDKPHGRYWSGVGYSEDDSSLVVFGGSYGIGPMNETWILNTDEKRWTQLSSQDYPTRRVISDMVYVESQRSFILFGGGNRNTTFEDTWRLDTETWDWSEVQTNYSSRDAVSTGEQSIIPGYSLISIIIGVSVLIHQTKKLD